MTELTAISGAKKLPLAYEWDNVKYQIQLNENAYIIFDDILDKRYSQKIELTLATV
jgi:hypothetical protein